MIRRGRHRRVIWVRLPSSRKPEYLWLLILLPVIQIAIQNGLSDRLSEQTRIRVVVLVSCVVLAIALYLNRWLLTSSLRFPLLVFLAGVLFNSIPRIVLGGMPFSVELAGVAGVMPTSLRVHQFGHIPMAPGDMCWFPLSDFVPVSFLSAVFSFGDIVMVIGLTCVALRLVRTMVNGADNHRLQPMSSVY